MSSRRPFTWSALLWALIYPRRGHQTMPTLPGVVLISVAFGIGIAAYNSSSNILFLTLSLLLTCLILSGLLSWLNLRGLHWRLRLAPTLRAGHDTVVGLELRNAKSFLPTYGLGFELAARPLRPDGAARAETTLTARGIDIRAALARAQAEEVRGRVALAGRLDPRATTQLDWVFQPARRGRIHVGLESVSSLFPFGFLRKLIGTSLAEDAVVWPAPIEYRRVAPAAARPRPGNDRSGRAGSGNDLIAVRRYRVGDSHRLIHWKASARTRQLLVRQFSAEIAQGCWVWLRTDAGMWPRPAQFEVLISFAATFSEDLFRAGRLLGVALDGEPPVAVRGLRELEQFLDRLAVVEPSATATANPRLASARNLLTFAPDGARGVNAYVDGHLTASA